MTPIFAGTEVWQFTQSPIPAYVWAILFTIPLGISFRKVPVAPWQVPQDVGVGVCEYDELVVQDINPLVFA